MYILENHKRQTIGYSFRICEEYLEILRKDAEREGISVNALVNRVLQNYCEYHRFAERFQMISLTRTTFAEIIDSCPQDRLHEIAEKSGSVVTRDALQTYPLPQTYNGLMTFLATNMSKHSGWYDLYHHNNGGKEILHLRHELGRKWSDFIAKQVSETFASILNIKTETETFYNYATIHIHK